MCIESKKDYILNECSKESVELFNVMLDHAKCDVNYKRKLDLWLNDENNVYSTVFLRDELIKPVKEFVEVKRIVEQFAIDNTFIAPQCLLSNLWYGLDSASYNWKRKVSGLCG